MLTLGHWCSAYSRGCGADLQNFLTLHICNAVASKQRPLPPEVCVRGFRHKALESALAPAWVP